eukprot:TRINITY_DN11781_c0_g1_i1.p2 TRINITY_DN11781_c0_g1~~TRINITY_DN11781_c0_g1_i1.p2  ORF type:complete len:134 (-),score=9.41 TRINITY_DN11781_c0_g1_i1:18-419(-)
MRSRCSGKCCRWMPPAPLGRTLSRSTPMPRYSFVVHTNPADGREDEFNAWYSGPHLAALLDCPGVISARRFRLSDSQVREVAQPFHYLAIYEIETDHPQSFVRELLARAGTELLPTSSTLAPGTSAVLWEAMT